MDLVPQAIEVLERAMRGRPGYGSLDIVKTELERLRAMRARAEELRTAPGDSAAMVATRDAAEVILTHADYDEEDWR